MTLRGAVMRLRARYRAILREETGATVTEPAEIDEELRFIFAEFWLRPNEPGKRTCTHLPVPSGFVRCVVGLWRKHPVADWAAWRVYCELESAVQIP